MHDFSELTTHGHGLLEDPSDLWVDVDHKILLDGDLLMTSIDLLLHPFGE